MRIWEFGGKRRSRDGVSGRGSEKMALMKNQVEEGFLLSTVIWWNEMGPGGLKKIEMKLVDT